MSNPRAPVTSRFGNMARRTRYLRLRSPQTSQIQSESLKTLAFIRTEKLISITLLAIGLICFANTCSSNFIPSSNWRSIQLEAEVNHMITDSRSKSLFLATDKSIINYSQDLQKLQKLYTPNALKTNLILNLHNKSRTILSCWIMDTINNTLGCFITKLDEPDNIISLPWQDQTSRNVKLSNTEPRVRLTVLRKDNVRDLIITSDRYNDISDGINSNNEFVLDGLGQYQMTRSDTMFGIKQISRIMQKARIGAGDLSFNYVYAFTYENYSYFIINEVLKSSSNEKKQTKIARICNNDMNLVSYVEVSLLCSPDSVAKNAFLHLSEPSSLYVVFEKSELKSISVESKLCVYPMALITDNFNLATRDCHEARGNSKLLSKIVGYQDKAQPCTKSASNDDWCRSNQNSFIDGTFNEIQFDRKIDLDSMGGIAFVYVMSQGRNQDILFVGSDRGQITKMLTNGFMLYTLDVFDSSTTFYHLQSKFEFQKDDRRRLTAFNYDETSKLIHIATSEKRIVQFNTSSCSYYSSCKICLVNRDPLGCVWCNDHCSTVEGCGDATSDSCPPLIKDFSPKVGPLSGDTKLSISGENLGLSSETTSVLLDDEPCIIDNISSELIECRTTPLTFPKQIKLKISVQSKGDIIEEKGIVSSSEFYSFEKVEVDRIEPKFGPRAGGTNILIFGRNLNIGHNRTVLLGESVGCQIIEESSERVMCRSEHFKGISDSTNVTLKFLIDNKDQAFHNHKFEFRLDPAISNIDTPALLVSSNPTINIYGTNFKSVFQPFLKITTARKETTNKCFTKSDTHIQCPLPKLDRVWADKAEVDNPLEVGFSILLDGSQAMKSYLKLMKLESMLKYYPDPTFRPEVELKLIADKIVFHLSGANITSNYPIDIRLNNGLGDNCTNLKVHNSSSLTCEMSESLVDRTIIHSLSILVGDQQYKTASFTINLDGKIDMVTESPSHSSVSSFFWVTTILALIIFIIWFIVKNKTQLSELASFKILNLKDPESNDKENSMVAFRNPANQKFNRSKSAAGDSIKDLVKLNGSVMTTEYFGAKSELLEPSQSLINDFVDQEMVSLLIQERILINRNSLTLGHVLGSGQFGRVYKGFLRIEGTGDHIEVAVKTLHNRSSWCDEVDNRAFLEEGLMMRDFEHENVLALIGVTFDTNGLPMVITPFMLYGDLRSYISDETSSPKVRDLIHYGTQVAKGMAYLSNLKFVHRDLAARNCMLNEDLVVKVADFGLSRDIYERDYYSSDNKKTKLPVKWMAIESLEKCIYNTKTDVWSYGVLLWELMTRGVVPYPDVDNFDLFSYLKEGRRMLRPFYCPTILYDIMLSCWAEDPNKRPTFDELVDQVSNVITELEFSSAGQQKVGRDKIYCDF